MHYIKARDFIYKNARPIDIARWKYLFENGPKEDVLTALSTYQNEDGGFAHALEPDCWNPNSAPVQTWVATEIIKEVQLEDKNHPIILGILKYLASGKDFNDHTWANTISSNNDFPMLLGGIMNQIRIVHITQQHVLLVLFSNMLIKQVIFMNSLVNLLKKHLTILKIIFQWTLCIRFHVS